ncbi:MAG TPA: PIN domain-containing protein [Gemmatimonadaceae bacterium]|nr:PIN domain-containing protein [Gemmatimonadaceae bacterium]HRQ77615.1 PIN domain-containing protein [Gemmatimonadaceae bacterium]
MKILDVNVLIHLADKSSEHHARVHEFVERAHLAPEVIGLPWHSILGFLRIITRRIACRSLVEPDAAHRFMSALLERPNVQIVEPGSRHWAILQEIGSSVGLHGNRYPDAHLAALAIENAAEMVSTDTDFARFPRLKWTDPTRAP